MTFSQVKFQATKSAANVQFSKSQEDVNVEEPSTINVFSENITPNLHMSYVPLLFLKVFNYANCMNNEN